MWKAVEGCSCEACVDARKREVEAASEVKEAPASRILTHERVLEGDPCDEYRNRFADRFPEQVEVTVELAVSQAEDWDWDWAGSVLLTREGRRKFNRLSDEATNEYDTAMMPYWDLCDKAYSLFYTEYDAAMADIRATRPELGWSTASELVIAKNGHIRDIPVAARDAAEKIASKRRLMALAKTWAEIYISEADND